MDPTTTTVVIEEESCWYRGQRYYLDVVFVIDLFLVCSFIPPFAFETKVDFGMIEITEYVVYAHLRKLFATYEWL